MASDYGRMASRVSDLRDNLEDKHERATESANERMQNEVRNELVSERSVARTTLLRDIRESESAGSQMVSRSVHVPEWGKYLEHGTGARAREDTLPDHESYPAPSAAPYYDILEWMKAKPVPPQEYDNVEDAAAAAAKTIMDEGTFPHPFLRPAWYGTYGYRKIIEANKNAISRALRRM
jgi:hypothetical protein